MLNNWGLATWAPSISNRSRISHQSQRWLDLIQLRDLCEVLGYGLPQFINEYEEALASSE